MIPPAPRFRHTVKKMKIEILDEVDSTNEYIKRYLATRENVVVSARRQTGGKGTKGRSFLSEEGGVYLSALTFYQNLSSNEAFRIMTHAAVSVCRTAEAFGVSPEIKWPNDVLVSGRKLCGILIENGFCGNRVDHSIVGIGLNVKNDVSELGGIAISLKEIVSQNCTVDEVRNALIANLSAPSDFDSYLSYIWFLGREISVTEGDKTYRAIARRILPDGRLEVQSSCELRALSSAEIKIRL